MTASLAGTCVLLGWFFPKGMFLCQEEIQAGMTIYIFVGKRSIKFQLIWPNCFREDFFNWKITNKNCLWQQY
jgi:hypothetical protein